MTRVLSYGAHQPTGCNQVLAWRKGVPVPMGNSDGPETAGRPPLVDCACLSELGRASDLFFLAVQAIDGERQVMIDMIYQPPPTFLDRVPVEGTKLEALHERSRH
jgi:hypothetical protein